MTSGEQGKSFRVWRNCAPVTEPGILEILQVNPVVLGVLAVVSGAGKCTGISRFERLVPRSTDLLTDFRFGILLWSCAEDRSEGDDLQPRPRLTALTMTKHHVVEQHRILLLLLRS